MEEKLGKIESIGSIILMIINILTSLIAVIQNYVWLLAISIVFLIAITIYWYTKYKKRNDFVNFIEFLHFNSVHKFNLLPKICLKMDCLNRYNKLDLSEMKVTYTYDMREVKTEELEEGQPIEYKTKIKYYLKAKNKKLPSEFFYYSGNVYGGEIDSLYQKQEKEKEDGKEELEGEEGGYKLVPHQEKNNGGRLNVEYRSWKLEKDKKPKEWSVYPIIFYTKYNEKNRNFKDTVILYPKQYAKNIDKLIIKFDFLGDKVKIKNIDGYEVKKNNKEFLNIGIFGYNGERKTKNTQQVSENIQLKSEKESDLTVEIKSLNNTEDKVYYFELEWELINNKIKYEN